MVGSRQAPFNHNYQMLCRTSAVVGSSNASGSPALQHSPPVFCKRLLSAPPDMLRKWGERPFHRPQPPLTHSLPSAGKHCIEVSRLNLCLLHPCSCNIFLFFLHRDWHFHITVSHLRPLAAPDLAQHRFKPILAAAPGRARFGTAQIPANFGGRAEGTQRTARASRRGARSA